MNRGERKEGREKKEKKKRNTEREKERERKKEAVECRLIDTILGDARNSSRRTIYRRTSETNFHLDPFDGLFRLPPLLPLAISNGWRTSEKKRKRKKRKKKVRDVQCLNHSDRRVIAPAKEEINRDLIARIFGFTAIPRVTRFKRFSIVYLSRYLTDTVRLAPALRSFGIKFNVSRNDSSGTRRTA